MFGIDYIYAWTVTDQVMISTYILLYNTVLNQVMPSSGSAKRCWVTAYSPMFMMEEPHIHLYWSISPVLYFSFSKMQWNKIIIKVCSEIEHININPKEQKCVHNKYQNFLLFPGLPNNIPCFSIISQWWLPSWA